MNFRDTSELRTRLWQINVEYSALVRERCAEGRFVRMAELRAERRALMTLMAAGASDDRRPLVSQQRQPEVVPASALSLRGRGQSAAATALYEDVDRL